jgi:hypothetical protein
MRSMKKSAFLENDLNLKQNKKNEIKSFYLLYSKENFENEYSL